MPKTVKYIGTTNRWPELAVTGKQSVWMPGQMDERTDSEAAQLLATGLFADQDALNQTPAETAALAALVSGAGRTRTSPVRVAIFGDSTANIGNLQNVGTATNHAADRVIVDAWNSGTKSFGLQVDKWALPSVYPMAYLVGIGGKSGQTTAQMVARDAAAAATDRMAVADIQTQAPDVVLLRGGSINNLLTVTAGTVDATVATCVSEHIYILNRLLSAGITVIDEGIYGFTNGTANTATSEATTRAALVAVNTQIAAYITALNSERARFIDWTGIVRDSSGAYLSGMSVDGTHLSVAGSLAAAAQEAAAMRWLFGPSSGIRYPGSNYVANANMALYGASVAVTAYPQAGTATGYTLAGTNATVGSQTLEVIDGKVWQTGVWTLSAGSANTCIINMPFDPSGTGSMAITSGTVWGFEFDLLIQGVNGYTPITSDTGLYGQVRFVNSVGSGDVYVNVLTVAKGFTVTADGIKLHVVIPPVRIDDVSANLTTGSRFQMQLLLPAQTGQVKLGVAQPRIVKLGQAYLTV